MKLVDRIRPIAETPQYSEFANRWRAFRETGHAADPARMIELGRALHQDVMRAASDHARAQVRNPALLTTPQADQLIAEARRGAYRALRKQLPELAEYADFVAMALRNPRPTVEA